jgi:purine-binding chemotaxis protein CheW
MTPSAITEAHRPVLPDGEIDAGAQAITNDDHAVRQMGLIRIGTIDLAIPSRYLREAIEMPPRLSPILSASPNVVGIVDVRGDLVPVIDLRPSLGLPPTGKDDSQRRIVIIDHLHHLFGIVVDALGGVFSLSREQCHPIEILEARAIPLVREVFSMDEGRSVVSVLCLDGVIHLNDIPLTCLSDKEQQRRASRGKQCWRPYVLFECGQTRLAINADVVDTVINLDSLGTTFKPSDTCLGLLQTESRRLAVLDVLALLGLGASEPQTDRQVLVIKVGSDSVGLLIRQVTQIARLDDTSTRVVPPMAFDSPQFFDGMLPLEGHGDFLKIAHKALLGMVEISSMASIHGRPISASTAGVTQIGQAGQNAQPSAAEASVARRAEVYLTFKVGVELAAPLKQIREILPLPQTITPIHRPGDARVGLFTHRDQVIPIMDLACLLDAPGAQSRSSDSRLLLIDAEHGLIALLVEQVYAIEQPQWAHAPVGLDQLRGLNELQSALRTRVLLTLGEQSGTRSRGVHALDLQRIARAIEAQFSPPAPLEAAA